MANEQQQKRTEISEVGEFGLIRLLTSNLKTNNDSTIKGVGDDAAVIDYGGRCTVVTTDMLVEGVHFDMMYSPLKHLGYKAIICNLSDIYAMNAIPEQVTVSLAISNRFSVEALEELYFGMKHACDTYGIDLVGGDTTSSLSGMVMSVTALGSAKEEEIVYRDTAKVGDLVCVTGDLGGAYLGLQILEREKQLYLDNPDIQPDLEDQKYLVGRQLKPEARRDIIETLREKGVKPTAMIDISDGLSSDLLHICKGSKVGARIFEGDVPIAETAYNKALDFNLNPITPALSGGEDYELLFTISPDDKAKLEEVVDIIHIGEITEESEGVKLHSKGGNTHDISAIGWDALLKAEQKGKQ